MLASRVATAAVGIPLGLLIMYWGGIPFVAFILAASLLGLSELYAAVEKRGDLPIRPIGYVAAVAVILGLHYLPESSRIPFAAMTLGLVTIATLATQIFREEDPSSAITNSAVTLLGVVYVVWLFGFFIVLRDFEAPALAAAVGDGFRGRTGLLFIVLACTWSTDTGAYFAGRFLGKRKLAPRVSPGKTIEGSIGGLAAAIVIGLAFGLWLHMPVWKALVLGALVGSSGQVGDLSKSVMKREVGIKDFGALLPGHGGVLDRFDSLLVTVFISTCYFMLVGA